jgi:hypothetical protein
MEPKPGEFPLTSLLRDLRDEFTTLFRQEVSLAKAEITEKLKQLAKNLTFLVVGGALGFIAVIFFLFMLHNLITIALVSAGLSSVTASWLSPLLIAVAVGISAWGFISHGRKELSKEDLTPRKTIATLREDQQWAKEKLAHT